jgi:hypothetical protein
VQRPCDEGGPCLGFRVSGSGFEACVAVHLQVKSGVLGCWVFRNSYLDKEEGNGNDHVDVTAPEDDAGGHVGGLELDTLERGKQEDFGGVR